MTLDKASLKETLKAIFEAEGNTSDSVADQMADAIDTFVKSGTVNVTVTGVTGPCVVGVPASITAQPGTGTVS